MDKRCTTLYKKLFMIRSLVIHLLF